MFRPLAILFFMLVTVLSSGGRADETDKGRWVLDDRRTVGPYVLKLFRHEQDGTEFEQRLDIERDGQVLRSIDDYKVLLDDADTAAYAGQKPRPFDADLTNDGIPDLVVETFSGGAHCCWSYYIFSLGETFRQVGEMITNDASVTFRNIDREADFEGLSNDTNFAYWYTSFAESPMPDVIFKFRDGEFRIARELMRAPQIAEDELREAAAEIKASDAWGPADDRPYSQEKYYERYMNARYEPQLWKVMLNLIYTGHYARAERFLDEAWPENINADKARFRTEFFQCQLPRSPYWPDIAAMNGIEVLPPRADCPPGPEGG